MKSYAIELTLDQETFLKVRFHCQTDAELRSILQLIVIDLINKQQALENMAKEMTLK